MKRILAFVFLFLSLVTFGAYSQYVKGDFDYDTAQIISYLFYWFVTIFLLSLFAIVLKYKEYKFWITTTIIIVLTSFFVAVKAGDGSSAIISFDGKNLTWIFVGIYSFLSLIYFFFQYFKNKTRS